MLAAKPAPLQPAPGPAVEELTPMPGTQNSEAATAVESGSSAEHNVAAVESAVHEGPLVVDDKNDNDNEWTELVSRDEASPVDDQLALDQLALDVRSGVVVDDVAAAIAANALPTMSRGPRLGLQLGGRERAHEDEQAPLVEGAQEMLEPTGVATMADKALEDAYAAQQQDAVLEDEQQQYDAATESEKQEQQSLSLPPLDGDGVLRTRHGEYFNPSLRRRIAPTAEQQPGAAEEDGSSKSEEDKVGGGGLLEQASRGLQVASRGLQQARPYIAARMIRYLPAADPQGGAEGGAARRPGALTTAHGSYFDSKRRRQLLLQRESAAREQQRVAAEAERAAAMAAVAAEEAAVRRREEEVVQEEEPEVGVAEDCAQDEDDDHSPLPCTADGVRERLRRKLWQQEQSRKGGWMFF